MDTFLILFGFWLFCMTFFIYLGNFARCKKYCDVLFQTNPRFITGGINNGIMKYLGEARARFCICVCVCMCVSLYVYATLSSCLCVVKHKHIRTHTSHTHAYAHKHTQAHTHTQTRHKQTHMHTHTYTFNSHTHARSLSLCLSPPPPLSLSLSHTHTCACTHIRYNPSAPCIGIVPLGVVRGNSEFYARATGSGVIGGYDYHNMSYDDMKTAQRSIMPAELVSEREAYVVNWQGVCSLVASAYSAVLVAKEYTYVKISYIALAHSNNY